VVCLSICHNREPTKTAEPIEMSFGMWIRVGARKHVLDGVRIGATWRIRLNHPYAAVIEPYVKLL